MLSPNTLSQLEFRTYTRWYSDLARRRGGGHLLVGDVESFIENFGLSPADRKKVLHLTEGTFATIDSGNFFAAMRLMSHVLEGSQPHRSLIYVPAPIPQPKSILAKKKRELGPVPKRVSLSPDIYDIESDTHVRLDYDDETSEPSPDKRAELEAFMRMMAGSLNNNSNNSSTTNTDSETSELNLKYDQAAGSPKDTIATHFEAQYPDLDDISDRSNDSNLDTGNSISLTSPSMSENIFKPVDFNPASNVKQKRTPTPPPPRHRRQPSDSSSSGSAARRPPPPPPSRKHANHIDNNAITSASIPPEMYETEEPTDSEIDSTAALLADLQKLQEQVEQFKVQAPQTM
ncbi:hypothetical protein CANCADRAFT_2892 [Tortispora caseinolytica NRRL Y-17796]|uniref:Uncharacterized protein n=1 Tax=Tortispora caseinolytica NRRL Y-17796 TaxID=767744 RepID=A0A1E4THF2_9ASCO|nr:hypothetical protein CANCADRAFT_2892 [Tortispora caseinolytica NRRL Y-17796]